MDEQAQPNPDVVHVLPVNDLIEHEDVGDGCACLPHTTPVEREDGSYGWVITHNAWDGRK